ncbi:MAG: 5'/3'-nucleotidase SurE [Desulfobacteraceae bacterium]|nr:5'/3'-nucleotidase SurE [Desulfobacteraceae bacterium]
MNILLTNDDGYQAIGIQILYEALCCDHDVTLAAPDREKSAVGHGITLNAPLRIDSVNLNCGDKGFAISGSPADCVKLALFELFQTPPDLVISGMNNGSNTGININYSGTAAAAREAALNGIPGIAVSLVRGEQMDYQGVAELARQLAGQMKKITLPFGTFLNINAPDRPMEEIRGIKITRQASNNLSTEFEKKKDPKNKNYFWYGNITPIEAQPDTDVYAIANDYISITPVQCDHTDNHLLPDLNILETAFLN